MEIAYPLAGVVLPTTQLPKVLLYYPDFGATGGIERFIITLARGLMDRGQWEPVIACSADTPFYQQALAAGLTVRGVRTFQMFRKPGWRWLDLLSLTQLKLILDREQPDLVHVHIGQLENVWLHWLGYPVVYSFHGYGNLYATNIPGRFKQVAKRLLRPLFQFSASKIQRMVFVSHYEHERMLAEGYLQANTCPVNVIHNAIDAKQLYDRVFSLRTSAELAAFRHRYDIPADSPCITFLNRLDANKDPLGFVRWAEQFCQGIYHHSAVNALNPSPLPVFLVVGDGPLAGETVLAISRSPLARQFRFLGFQTDITPVLAMTDVAVFMPKREGFGIGILECVAAEIPCVAPNTGGIPEIFPNELAPYCLFTPDDWMSLDQRVMAWLNPSSDNTATLTNTLRSYVTERFSILAFLQGFERVYDDVRVRFHHG